MTTPPVSIGSMLRLPSGAVLPNRVCKASMTEAMADPVNNLPTVRHQRLYRNWAAGGSGLLLTGNLMVDRRYLECPRNVALEASDAEDKNRFQAYVDWATAARDKASTTFSDVPLSSSTQRTTFTTTTTKSSSKSTSDKPDPEKETQQDDSESSGSSLQFFTDPKAQLERKSQSRSSSTSSRSTRNKAMSQFHDLPGVSREAVRPLCLVQISHPGRQCPLSVSTQTVSASDVPVKLKGLPSALAPIVRPRPLTSQEIEEIIWRFADTAELCFHAGFDGVQVHSAHGYLLSQFLSPLTNHRKDKWGGSWKNRSRLLMRVVRAIKQRLRHVASLAPSAGSGDGEGEEEQREDQEDEKGSDSLGQQFPQLAGMSGRKRGRPFVVAVKLNSADFQRGGFDAEDSLRVLRALEAEGVDFVEISGGTYESAKMMQTQEDSKQQSQPKKEEKRSSTEQREAFFMEFCREARQACPQLTLMLTGGFRTVQGCLYALNCEVGDVQSSDSDTEDSKSQSTLRQRSNKGTSSKSSSKLRTTVQRGAVDLIGMARPLALNVNLPKYLVASCSYVYMSPDQTKTSTKRTKCLFQLRNGERYTMDIMLYHLMNEMSWQPEVFIPQKFFLPKTQQPNPPPSTSKKQPWDDVIPAQAVPKKYDVSKSLSSRCYSFLPNSLRKTLNNALQNFWYQIQMANIADDKPPNPRQGFTYPLSWMFIRTYVYDWRKIFGSRWCCCRTKR